MVTRTRARAGAAGFSLVELLAVLVILAILMTFLITQLSKGGEVVKERGCRADLELLAAAIGEYESETGSYPPSSFREEWGQPPNKINLGAEALVVALWSEDWAGTRLPEERLGNTDGDRAKKSLTTMPSADLLEFLDPWGNPVAYISRSDYKREDVYATYDGETGEPIETSIRAYVNETTGRPYQPHGFQLISAGVDGQFGTEDDITNFDRR